eukprot:2709791-Rhodomonas_salina.2
MAGDYEIVAEIVDVLLRKQGRDTLIRFSVSDEGVTSMACTPGQPLCVPQRPPNRTVLDSLPALAAQIQRDCPALSPEVLPTGNKPEPKKKREEAERRVRGQEGAVSDCSGRGVALGGGCFCFPVCLYSPCA